MFKQLLDKGDVYRTYQMMPYSTALCIPLSYMESTQNGKITQDPAVWCPSPCLVLRVRRIYVLSSTRLPPGLCLRISSSPSIPTLSTCKSSGRRYIMLESGLTMLYKDPTKARDKIPNKIPRKSIVGWIYI